MRNEKYFPEMVMILSFKYRCLQKHFFKYICVFRFTIVASLAYFPKIQTSSDYQHIKPHLHMDAVGQDGQAGDGVDEDDLGEGGSGAGAGVDHCGVSHRLQPVQGNGGQTQGRDVDGNTLEFGKMKIDEPY